MTQFTEVESYQSYVQSLMNIFKGVSDNKYKGSTSTSSSGFGIFEDALADAGEAIVTAFDPNKTPFDPDKSDEAIEEEIRKQLIESG